MAYSGLKLLPEKALKKAPFVSLLSFRKRCVSILLGIISQRAMFFSSTIETHALIYYKIRICDFCVMTVLGKGGIERAMELSFKAEMILNSFSPSITCSRYSSNTCRAGLAWLPLSVEVC